MAKQIAITTTDNPYDYFDEFDQWYNFDVERGYNTCAYIGRLIAVSPSDSDQERHEELERVIDEALKLNITGNYIKVERDD